PKRQGLLRRLERLERQAMAGLSLSRPGMAFELAAFAWSELAERPASPNPLLLWSGWAAAEAARIDARGRPRIDVGPYHPTNLGPARDAMTSDPRTAAPALALVSNRPGRSWSPQPDLLSKPAERMPVTAEVDERNVARLRFDDDTPGLAPQPDELTGKPDGGCVELHYRFGNGTAGNVGAEAIRHLIGPDGEFAWVKSVRNPLPAAGGVDPEPVATAKAEAPTAFRDRLLRAVTADDYTQLAQRDPRVQRAAPQLTWTGTGLEARVGIDLKAEPALRAGSGVGQIYREIQAD